MTLNFPPAILVLAWACFAFLAAILFGGNDSTISTTLTATALILTAATLSTTPSRQKWPLFPLGAMGLVLAWGVAQIVPWPSMGNPLWVQAGQALSKTLPQTISISPSDTLAGLAQGAAYLGTFLAAWLLAQRGRSASLMLRLMALTGVAIAAAGLAMYATGNQFIWNFPKSSYMDDLTATFINRNTYATFAGLTILLNLAVALERWGELPSARRTPWRQRVQSFLNLILMPRWGYFVGAGIGLVALMLTHSRAGTICSVLGVVVMVTTLFLQRRQSWSALVTVGLLLTLGFMATFSMLGDATNQRLSRAGHDTIVRSIFYNITAQAIHTTPYTGSGLGTFEETFRTARTPKLHLSIGTRVDHAHNTWLQLALELGLPAFALLLAAIGWVLSRLISGLGERRRGVAYPALGLGAAALVGTHGLVDFSLQIPGVAYTTMMVLGLTLAQSKRNAAEDGPAPSRLPGLALLAVPVAALAVTLPTLWAEWQTTTARQTVLNLQYGQPATTEQLVKTRQELLPYAARYANELTITESVLVERAKPNVAVVNAYRRHLAHHATMALSAAPASPYTWHRLAANRIRAGGPQAAGKALAMSLLTGPYEPGLAQQRLPLVAVLMPHMSPDDQAFAQSLLHSLWLSSSRPILWRSIRNNPTLQRLVADAIAHDPEAVTLWEKVSRKPFPVTNR